MYVFFSAEASFGASAVIMGIGAVSIKKAQTPSQTALEVIPVFFAIQQFTEGLLWVSLLNPNYQDWINLTTHIFLFFAWIVWPVYIPFTVRLLEKNKKRKRILTLFLIIGAIVSIHVAYRLFLHDVYTEIQGSHIEYMMDYKFTYPGLAGALYFIPIVVSLFVSSTRRMHHIAIMVLLTFVVTALFYRDHLISVWCFFAAITSISILWCLYGIKSAVITPAPS